MPKHGLKIRYGEEKTFTHGANIPFGVVSTSFNWIAKAISLFSKSSRRPLEPNQHPIQRVSDFLP
jgi:hypothetical protein